MKILGFLLNEFIYNGHMQSLGGVGVVYVVSELLFRKPVEVELLLLVYLTLQAIYTFDRYRDFEKDKETNKERMKHLQVYWRYMPAIIAVMLLAVAAISLRANVATLVMTGVVIAFGLMYPVYFKGLTRKVFLFKNLYVSSVYAIFMFYPMVYEAGWVFSSYVWFLFIYIWVEMMISQFGLDLKDTEFDKRAGFLTMPAVLGVKRTWWVSMALALAVFFVFLGVGWEYFRLGAFWGWLLLFNLGWNWGGLFYIKRKRKVGFLMAAAKFFGWLGVGMVGKIII